MTNQEQTLTPGKTTIAIDVLLTIASLTTLNIPGVSRLSNLPRSAMTGMLRRGQFCEGVCIDVENNTVFADVFVILKNDVNIRDVSRNIQREVARAISEMVGMQVGRINVHIDDIDYAAESKA